LILNLSLFVPHFDSTPFCALEKIKNTFLLIQPPCKDPQRISATENSNKFQKTRFWKEKSVEDVVTLRPL
jgi:hypothetical protein